MQTEMAEMRRLMQKFMTLGATTAMATAEDGNGEASMKPTVRDEWEDVRRVYKGINRTHFANWVGRNFEIIQGYPSELQAEIKEKFERLYEQSYPVNVLEATASLSA
jgi:hypothetical protein